jgi:hypothetical protein
MRTFVLSAAMHKNARGRRHRRDAQLRMICVPI